MRLTTLHSSPTLLARHAARKLLSLALALHPPGFSEAPALPSGDPLVLTGATLIDGTGAHPRLGTTLLVRAGRIAEVYADGSRPLDAGATVIALEGGYVIPGLIDAHVHLATDPEGRDSGVREALRDALLGGVTCVRDMAGDALVLAELARAAEPPEAASPRIRFAAVLAGPTCFEDPRTRSSAHGGTPGDVAWLQAITPTTDVRAALARARATGAAGIKLYADLDAAALARIVPEAHRQGLAVWSHGTVFPARPSDAVDAGVDTLSHALLLYWQGAAEVPARYHARPSQAVYDEVAPRGPELDALFTRMRERGAVLDATLFVSSRLESAPSGTAGMRDPRRAVQWMYDATRRARELGVAVAAGTDGMSPGGRGELPNLHREMQLLVERAGFTPLEAIVAATRNSARAAGVEASCGTVEAGKRADLLVLGADPTADIRNTRSIRFVVKGGRLHARTWEPAGSPAPEAR